MIAILDIAHPDLALTPTIRDRPDTSIEVVPHSTTDPETGLFFYLVEGADEAFEDVLEQDHTVTDWMLADDLGSARIYRLQHPEETVLISPLTTELGGLLLDAETTGRGWTTRVQLPDREALADLWDCCETRDISFELRRMFRCDEWTGETFPEVTDEQRAALVSAHEEGYFEEPREISLAELAEQLGISSTAASGRIRRGTGQLVASTLREE